MAITLKKGQKLSLSKEGLTKATIGLGWLINQYDTGENADLDSSVFMLGEDGKVPSDAEFIYYNQPKHSSGAVIHNGDNKKGKVEFQIVYFILLQQQIITLVKTTLAQKQRY